MKNAGATVYFNLSCKIQMFWYPIFNIISNISTFSIQDTRNFHKIPKFRASNQTEYSKSTFRQSGFLRFRFGIIPLQCTLPVTRYLLRKNGSLVCSIKSTTPAVPFEKSNARTIQLPFQIFHLHFSFRCSATKLIPARQKDQYFRSHGGTESRNRNLKYPGKTHEKLLTFGNIVPRVSKTQRFSIEKFPKPAGHGPRVTNSVESRRTFPISSLR